MHGPLLCMGSQAWLSDESQNSSTKRLMQVKCNTSMHQAITQLRIYLLGCGSFRNTRLEGTKKFSLSKSKTIVVSQTLELPFQITALRFPKSLISDIKELTDKFQQYLPLYT